MLFIVAFSEEFWVHKFDFKLMPFTLSINTGTTGMLNFLTI